MSDVVKPDKGEQVLKSPSEDATLSSSVPVPSQDTFVPVVDSQQSVDVPNFGGSGGEGTSVEVLKLALSPANDGNRLLMVGRHSAPKFYALLYAKADFHDRYRGKDKGWVRRKFADCLIMGEIGRNGKGNRVELVLEAAKAVRLEELELAKSVGVRAAGQ